MTWRIDRDTGIVHETHRNPLTTLQRRFLTPAEREDAIDLAIARKRLAEIDAHPERVTRPRPCGAKTEGKSHHKRKPVIE